MKKKISIALATYNGEKFLGEQLASFLSQSRPPDELIVSDDCSSDATVSIIREFSIKAPFKVSLFVNEKNNGYSQNFSNSLSHCNGDVVFLSDQDDVWLPTKIEKMMARFDSEPKLQLLIHDLEYCKEDLTPIGQTKIERMEESFDLAREYVVGMATAVRGPFLELCLPIPRTAGRNYDNWLHDCAWAIGRKEIMREVLALYRRHSSTATAASCLNVDFVTTPRDFKKSKVEHLLNLFLKKTEFERTEISPLVEWLQKNQDVLVSKGYASPVRIGRLIEVEVQWVERNRQRQGVLTLPRWKRILPILDFYRRGGYRCFSGWKSALKDFMLN